MRGVNFRGNAPLALEPERAFVLRISHNVAEWRGGARPGIIRAMTIVVTIRVTDGIVLAADSATSFTDQAGNVAKVYNSANKIFNLVKVWPIGAMTYGAGSIGTESISTLSKTLRDRLTPRKLPDESDPIALDEASYKIEDVARKAKAFFEERYKAAYPDPVPGYFLGYRVCGYSKPAGLPEAWEVRILEKSSEGPNRIYEDAHFGPRWAGETEALDRLILGVGSNMKEALIAVGAPPEAAEQTLLQLVNHMYATLFLPAMPIQDAIDLAQFLVETAVKFSHFSLRPATVGGPIEIATITQHEGFKWVKRKHYYSKEFNVEDGDAP
jgi:hypothetical protein